MNGYAKTLAIQNEMILSGNITRQRTKEIACRTSGGDRLDRCLGTEVRIKAPFYRSNMVMLTPGQILVFKTAILYTTYHGDPVNGVSTAESRINTREGYFLVASWMVIRSEHCRTSQANDLERPQRKAIKKKVFCSGHFAPARPINWCWSKRTIPRCH